MSNVMSHPLYVKTPAAARHLPVARGRDSAPELVRELESEARVRAPVAPSSEPRLHASVVPPNGNSELYADVPCTD
jgi:hypothetical protein